MPPTTTQNNNNQAPINNVYANFPQPAPVYSVNPNTNQAIPTNQNYNHTNTPIINQSIPQNPGINQFQNFMPNIGIPGINPNQNMPFNQNVPNYQNMPVYNDYARRSARYTEFLPNHSNLDDLRRQNQIASLLKSWNFSF